MPSYDATTARTVYETIATVLGARAPEQPREAAPEPPVASEAATSGDAKRGVAAQEPESTSAQAVAEESPKKPATSGAVAPRERERAEAVSSEIARAEIPSLRVERTVWHPAAERRVALIEFLAHKQGKPKKAEYRYSMFAGPFKGCWFPRQHKGVVYFPDSRLVTETRRIDRLHVNEPIARGLFDAQTFFAGVDFTDEFRKTYE